MKFSKILYFCAAAAAICLTSCMKNGENKTTQTLPGYLNTSFDSYGTEVAYCNGVGYTIDLNYDDMKADVTIEGLSVNGQKFTSMTFKDISWKKNSMGWQVIEAMNVTPVSQLPAPTFDNISLWIYQRYIGSQYMPFVRMSYSIGGQYIVSMPTALINGGTTTVTAPGQPDYVQDPDKINAEDQTYYIFTFDPAKSVAELSIAGAKFNDRMPAMNMRFKNIPYQVTKDGLYKLSISSIPEPVVVGSDGTETPNPSYPITDFYCSTDACNNMTLNFTCTVSMRPQGASEAVTIPYHVNVVCKGPDFVKEYN
ncbi:MAG: hypothetical protein K2N16_02345 [Muribaculaceae bacterium]|nr:hypothetical protein [Muribaculaceae bacterium]